MSYGYRPRSRPRLSLDAAEAQLRRDERALSNRMLADMRPAIHEDYAKGGEDLKKLDATLARMTPLQLIKFCTDFAATQAKKNPGQPREIFAPEPAPVTPSGAPHG